MKLTGIRHKMSTSYHPQTDGTSEHSNKTVIQCLRFHVERNQKGWVKVLPKVCFDIMNTINASTSVSPFILKMGRSPHILPPLNIGNSHMGPTDTSSDEAKAHKFVEEMEEETNMAKDSLLAAKIHQAHEANKDRLVDPTYQVGDKVLLAMVHWCHDYMQAKDG
jgi:hypothetical protein